MPIDSRGPSDPEIRRRFHEGTLPKGQIDVDAVLRRVRARRRPRVVIAGAASVLAIAAIAVPAALSSYTSGAGGSTDTAFVAGDGDMSAPESAAGGSADEQIARAPAEKLNLCTARVAEPVPSLTGLEISVSPVTASATSRAIPVTVTLTNAGAEPVVGTTGSRPALTLSQDSITLWHTNGPQDLLARIVDLAPGESMTYETTFEPTVCGVEDDTLESFRTDLPAAGPGAYQLSAAIDVTRDSDGLVDLVSGSAADVTLN
jgi:hypothetical protein